MKNSSSIIMGADATSYVGYGFVTYSNLEDSWTGWDKGLSCHRYDEDKYLIFVHEEGTYSWVSARLGSDETTPIDLRHLFMLDTKKWDSVLTEVWKEMNQDDDPPEFGWYHMISSDQ